MHIVVKYLSGTTTNAYNMHGCVYTIIFMTLFFNIENQLYAMKPNSPCSNYTNEMESVN